MRKFLTEGLEDNNELVINCIVNVCDPASRFHVVIFHKFYSENILYRFHFFIAFDGKNIRDRLNIPEITLPFLIQLFE